MNTLLFNAFKTQPFALQTSKNFLVSESKKGAAPQGGHASAGKTKKPKSVALLEVRKTPDEKTSADQDFITTRLEKRNEYIVAVKTIKIDRDEYVRAEADYKTRLEKKSKELGAADAFFDQDVRGKVFDDAMADNNSSPLVRGIASTRKEIYEADEKHLDFLNGVLAAGAAFLGSKFGPKVLERTGHAMLKLAAMIPGDVEPVSPAIKGTQRSGALRAYPKLRSLLGARFAKASIRGFKGILGGAASLANFSIQNRYGRCLSALAVGVGAYVFSRYTSNGEAPHYGELDDKDRQSYEQGFLNRYYKATLDFARPEADNAAEYIFADQSSTEK